MLTVNLAKYTFRFITINGKVFTKVGSFAFNRP
jgi:hypothetical protein